MSTPDAHAREEDEDLFVRDEGPSPRPAVSAAVLVSAAAVVATVLELRSSPGHWREAVVPVLLCLSVLLGAYSLARLLQLALYAVRRPARVRDREPSFALTQEHTFHAIWLVGLGGSIAFMGVLGAWSLLESSSSGLEPGWPLILIGAAAAALGAAASRLTTRAWERLQEQSRPRERDDEDR